MRNLRFFIVSELLDILHPAHDANHDLGVPTYNDAREAYGLSRASSFADVTPDSDVQALLEDAYGNDVGLLDAFTGALAEGNNLSTASVFGDLLQVRTGTGTAVLGGR